MKTPLVYGAGIAFANAVLVLLLHLIGFSTNPEKLLLTGIIVIPVAIAIALTGVVLAMRAARAERGPAGFSYGQAFKAGFSAMLVAGLIGVLFNFVYYRFIFPDFAEVSIEAARTMMERFGAPADTIERAIGDMRTKTTLTRQLVSGGVFSAIMGALVSLVAAAFLKRPPAEDVVLPPKLT